MLLGLTSTGEETMVKRAVLVVDRFLGTAAVAGKLKSRPRLVPAAGALKFDAASVKR